MHSHCSRHFPVVNWSYSHWDGAVLLDSQVQSYKGTFSLSVGCIKLHYCLGDANHERNTNQKYHQRANTGITHAWNVNQYFIHIRLKGHNQSTEKFLIWHGFQHVKKICITILLLPRTIKLRVKPANPLCHSSCDWPGCSSGTDGSLVVFHYLATRGNAGLPASWCQWQLSPSQQPTYCNPPGTNPLTSMD